MTIDSSHATSVAQPASSAAASDARISAEESVSSDFETFLIMLTAQLENQDPLNPIENQDFAVQLATFSSVEQQVLTNDLLKDLKGALGASDLAQLADWVGMEAKLSTPISFTGAPLELSLEPVAGADSADLVVRDTQGREVSREGIPVSGGTFNWAGRGPDGEPLANGSYALELESRRGRDVIGTTPVSHYGLVTEARNGTAGVQFVMKNGDIVSSDDVSGLRQPQLH